MLPYSIWSSTLWNVSGFTTSHSSLGARKEHMVIYPKWCWLGFVLSISPGTLCLVHSAFFTAVLHHLSEEILCNLKSPPCEKTWSLETLAVLGEKEKSMAAVLLRVLRKRELPPHHLLPGGPWVSLELENPGPLELCWNISSFHLLVLCTASEGVCSYALICSGALNV